MIMNDIDVINLRCPSGLPRQTVSFNNLLVNVYPTGKKVFYARYFDGKKQHKVRLGVWGIDVKTIAHAYQLRQSWIDESFKSKSKSQSPAVPEAPVEVIQLEPEENFSPKTFSDCYHLWLNIFATQVNAKTLKTTQYRFEKFVLPYLGNYSLNDISIPKVAPVFKVLGNRPDLQRRLVAQFNQVMNYAVCLTQLYINPCLNLGKVLAVRKQPVTNLPSIHYSQIDELIHTFLSSAHLNRVTKLLFIFSMLSLLRPGENVKIQWKNVDFKNNVITIEAEDMKKKRPFRLPIGNLMRRVLNAMKEYAYAIEPRYVFFSFKTNESKTEHMSTETVNKALNRINYKGILCSHGIRAIGRTWLRDNKFPFDVSEMMLAHKVGSDTVNAYMRSDLLSERLEAQNKWADYIESMDKEQEIQKIISENYIDNVIPLFNVV